VRLRITVVLLTASLSAAALAPAVRAAGKSSPPAAGSARRASARTGRMATPLAALVRAARKKDRAALERLATRMGAARLEEALASSDAAVAEAALAAIPLLRGRVLLAGALTDRLGAADPGVAAGSARALGELFDGTVPSDLDEWEVPPDTVLRACGGLRALASRLEAPVASRLAALDALASAQGVCSASAELASLLRDPVPAVRRAATQVVRPRERPVAAALRETIHDADPKVASAAVAAVCRSEAAPGTAVRKGDPLLDQSVVVARALAPAKTTPPEDAVEMLACVVAAGTPADVRLLEQLRSGPPSPLRDRAAELLESGARVRAE
jgi:hypothetical protein